MIYCGKINIFILIKGKGSNLLLTSGAITTQSRRTLIIWIPFFILFINLFCLNLFIILYSVQKDASDQECI